ncbi:hypothetical protein F5B20DRAFT_558852 [Whalleya microplaca]|nr:hypothetical protein F5B20DRAFT_558852 [Whalleya microplaca]
MTTEANKAWFRECCQRAILQWKEYREKGDDPRWKIPQTLARRNDWENISLPTRDGPHRATVLFNGVRQYTQYGWARYEKPDLDNLPKDADAFQKKLKKQVQSVKTFFGSNDTLEFQKVLATGGMGLALHFKYISEEDGESLDFVVKVGLESNWEDDGIREEEKSTRRMKHAAHCVQIIHPPEIGQDPLARYQKRPVEDDSSDAAESSGDDSVAEQPPPKKTRSQLLATGQAELRAKHQRHFARIQARDNPPRRTRGQGPPEEPREDYLLLEYVPNGDLQNLILKIQDLVDAAEERGETFEIPNRILWSMWLCLVRACVAMKYPPRKFHPDRPRPPKPEDLEQPSAKRRGGLRTRRNDTMADDQQRRAREYLLKKADLVEEVPPAEKRWRAKDMVHFDIDPKNVFIGDLGRQPRLPGSSAGGKGKGKATGNTRKRGRTNDDDDDEYIDSSRKRGRGTGKGKAVAGVTTRSGGKRAAPNDDDDDDDNEGKVADVEHPLVPRLKIADFGLAEVVKKRKRNIYYFNRRCRGKLGYLAPEQFCSAWDQLPPEPDAADVADTSVLPGYYTSATNVWGIAMTMWSFITQLQGPMPPNPQWPLGFADPRLADNFNGDADAALKAIGGENIFSYCPELMKAEDNEYLWADEELRRTIYNCMSHWPQYRPTVEQLLDQAQIGVTKQFEGESDAFIQQWVQSVIFNAA